MRGFGNSWGKIFDPKRLVLPEKVGCFAKNTLSFLGERPFSPSFLTCKTHVEFLSFRE